MCPARLRDVVLVGEIDRGLEEHEEVPELRPQRRGGRADRPFQLAQGRGGRGGGLRGDQVRQRLRLRQVHLPVLERPAREFAGRRRYGPQGAGGRGHALHEKRIAMKVDLDEVFPGKAAGRREEGGKGY